MSGFTARLHLHGMQVATRRAADPPGSNADADSWSAIVRMGGASLALSAVLSDADAETAPESDDWWSADTAEYPVVGEGTDEG